MSTSFDNLVSRKGSPTHSFRSGITNTSNMSSETRDLSRQSAQQARLNHRRAIQARKIVFLVLILLLILGGLSYAIYRVVSNDSNETESTTVKLEQDDKTSMPSFKTSSIITGKIKTSVARETKKTLILSKVKSVRTVHHVTSTVSTLKQADQKQKTTTLLNAKETPSLQSTIKRTNAHVTVQNAPSSFAESSMISSVETTKMISNVVKSSSTPFSTSRMNAYSSPETTNMPTSNLHLQSAASSLKMETTKNVQSILPTLSLETRKSSVVSNVHPLFHTATSIHESNGTHSSILNMKHASSSDTNPMPSKEKTVTSGGTRSSTVLAAKVPQSTKTLIQDTIPSIVFIKYSTSVTNTMSSTTSNRPPDLSLTSVSQISSVHVSQLICNSLTTKAQEQKTSSQVLMDTTTFTPNPQEAVSSTRSPELTNIFHAQSKSSQAFSSTVPMENNIIPTSSAEYVLIHSTTTTKIQHSQSVVENIPKYSSSAVVNSTSEKVWPSITQTRQITASNASRSIKHLETNSISKSIYHHASSYVHTPTMSKSGSNASVNVDASDKTTVKIQPTKTSTTPVISSSVWIPPYYHPWSNWSTCSRDCGGGYTFRTRNCSHYGHCDNLGPSVNTTICNLYRCNETTFDVSLNLTDFKWIDEFYNVSSEAYADLIEQLMEELRTLYGPNVSITIENISRGSVIVTFTITFPSSNQIINLTNAIKEGKIGNLSVSLVKLVNKMVPQAPDTIDVQNTTTNSTMIRWRSIQPNKTNGILQGYKVNLTPGNFSQILNGPETTSVTVVKLNPDTQYTITVLGFNINGDGERKSETFKTKELPPHFLPWDDWSNCSRDCGGGVMSRNRSCSKDNMCSHLGEYEQKEYCNVEKCNETSFEVGLNMTNVDWTDDLHNTSSAAYQELLAKFLEELRKKYPNATIDIGSITKGSVLFTFTITFPKETETDAETLSNDLEENGLGNYTTDVKKIENKNLPKVPPGSISVTMVTTHSTNINWLPISEDDSNGAILGYKIVLMSGHNNTMEFNVTAQASDNDFSYPFRMLKPNTTYRFYVYGYNINGDGPESKLFYFTTKVQIPKIYSTNITHVTITHALFSWQMINDNNHTYGFITGYKIFITHNHLPRLDLEVSSFQNEVHLNDLLPNTSYALVVFGYNQYGDGLMSDMSNFTTRVQIPKVVSANISHVTRTSAVLSWKKIADSKESYGIIDGYTNFLNCEDMQDFRNMTVSRNESEIELSDLHSGTRYNLTIVGFNSYGKGLVSDVIGFKTRDMIPKPNSVVASNITSTAAKLSWELIPPNEETYGNIDGYKIVIHHGSLVNTTTVREMASVFLQNISSNSTYCFHVFAFNNFGDGMQSDQLCFTTLGEQSEEISAKTSDILAATTTALVLVEQYNSSSVISQLPHQETQDSSSMFWFPSSSIPTSSTQISSPTSSSSSSMAIFHPTPTPSQTSSYTSNDIFTDSSHVDEVMSTKAKGRLNVLTSTVQPSSTTNYLSTTTAFVKSSSQPTITSTSVNKSVENETTPSTSPPVEVKYHVGKIRLTNETFSSELTDTDSQVFKALASKLEKMLENLFRAEGLEIESVKVLGFSKGSVVVDFYITTPKSMEYQTSNFTVVLVQAATNDSGLGGLPFGLNPNDFTTLDNEPTMEPIANEADKGLQKNAEDDDSALIVAVVLCVVLFIGIIIVAAYVGKKKNWFKRGKRKVLPEDDDDDDDDMYPSPAQDTVRLKTARAGRRSHGARINGGHSTTEC